MTGAMAPSDEPLPIDAGLRAGELDAAGELVREAGWNQVAADWRIFMDLGTVYAVRSRDARLVATAATLPFGDRFAWISMVLVTAEFRRGGLATRLLRRCIDDLLARNLTPMLDATPAGRSVYRPLGFTDVWAFHRWSRGAPVGEAMRGDHGVAPITDAVWPALCRYDARHFGADRSALLGRLRGRLPPAELYAERDGAITGFLLGRDGRSGAGIGPLIAEDDTTARSLLAVAFGALSGPLYVDLADAKTAVAAFLTAHGFAPQRPFTRMVYRRSVSFDDPARTYAVVGPEFG
jgi:GNAT superfamily N-acetyltransferase